MNLLICKLCLFVIFIIFYVAGSSGRVIGKFLSSESIIEKLEIALDSNETEEIFANKHQKFFKNLTEIEKEWILRLAIHHQADLLRKSSEIFEIDGVKNSSEEHQLGEIPDTVMEMMLNGEVSQTFQRKLTKWLKNGLGYSNVDFLKFGFDSLEFCKGDGECLSMKGIGGSCCPFG